MKKAVLAGAAALTLLDISASTPAEAQVLTNPFAGFYAGTHTGYMETDTTTFNGNPHSVTGLPADPTNVYPVPGRRDNFEFEGALAGVHSGFNFVTPGNFLIGVEGGFTYLNNSQSVEFNSGRIDIPGGGGDGVIFQHRSELELDWQGTIRGRAGFVAGNWLFFTTAGVAFMDVDWHDRSTVTDCAQICQGGDPTFTQINGDSEILVGAVVGGGVDVAITPTIILGTDYLYENFESFGSASFGHTNPGQIGNIGDLEVHKVRVRVSFKLGVPPQ